MFEKEEAMPEFSKEYMQFAMTKIETYTADVSGKYGIALQELAEDYSGELMDRCIERRFMVMAEKRKDSKGQILQKGEHQRTDGTYHYTWLDSVKKGHFIYAKTLPELRKKE